VFFRSGVFFFFFAKRFSRLENPLLEDLHLSNADSHVDTTSTNSLLNSEIPILSPGVGPAVLDNPEISSSGIDSPSNNEKSVVQLSGRARGRSDDSSRVIHEWRGIHGEREWAMCVAVRGHHILSDSSGVGICEANVCLDGSLNQLVVESTSAILGSVRVLSLSLNSTPRDHVKEGVPLPASTASLVADGSIRRLVAAAVRAVHDELFGESSESMALEGPLGLNVCNGAEGPARTALALIFDGRDDVLRPPVE